MHIIRSRGWEIPGSQVAAEAVVLNRRGLLAGSLALTIGGLTGPARAQTAPVPDPLGAIGPMNPKYEPGRDLSLEKDATTYNNYYEFSESKTLWREAQALKTRPWTIQIGGMVKQPRTLDIDDLLKQVN